MFTNTPSELLLEEVEKRIVGFDVTNKEGYLKLREHYNKTKDIFDLYVLSLNSFNYFIRFNQRGEFNLPYGRPYKMWQQKVQMVREFSEAMQNATYSSLDFRNLNLQSLGENDFVYCDPPYLLGDATYNESNRFGGGWNENDERDLLDSLEALSQNKVKFALSNVLKHKYQIHPLLPAWIDKNKFNRYDLTRHYRDGYNIKIRDASATQEVLITNY